MIEDIKRKCMIIDCSNEAMTDYKFCSKHSWLNPAEGKKTQGEMHLRKHRSKKQN